MQKLSGKANAKGLIGTEKEEFNNIKINASQQKGQNTWKTKYRKVPRNLKMRF